MGTTDNNNWTRVQQSVREAERLIGQKQYNLAMIKSRQTLEFMVNCLGEKALIVDGDLADSIDQLFEGHWISPVSYTHLGPWKSLNLQKPVPPLPCRATTLNTDFSVF